MLSSPHVSSLGKVSNSISDAENWVNLIEVLSITFRPASLAGLLRNRIVEETLTTTYIPTLAMNTVYHSSPNTNFE